MSNYLLPISFGIDEQLITCGAVLSGFVSYPQKKIIIALIIMALSNSLPDTLSYYDQKIEEGQSRIESLKLSFIVFISEIISTLIILIPFFILKNKNNAIIGCYILIALILVTSNYYKDYNIVSALSKLPIYMIIALIIWFISDRANKYYGITV